MAQVENDSVKPPPFNDLGPISDTTEAVDQLERLFAAEDGDEAEFNRVSERVERKAPPPKPVQESAQAEAPQSADTTEQEQTDESPSLEPPKSWSAEQKEVWDSLPPKTQEYVLQRETERDTALRRGQNELAEQRKAFEAQTQAQLQQAAEFAKQLPVLQKALLERVTNSEVARMTQQDWLNLAQSDPAKYVELQAKAQADQQLIQATFQAQQQIEAQTKAQAEAQRAEMIKAEWNKLIEVAPEFADPKAGPTLQKEIIDYLLEIGVPQEALGGMDRAFFLIAARDAVNGRKLAQKASKAPEQVKNLPPVARPGAAQRTSDQRTQQQFGADKTNISRARSTDDAAAILERYL